MKREISRVSAKRRCIRRLDAIGNAEVQLLPAQLGDLAQYRLPGERVDELVQQLSLAGRALDQLRALRLLNAIDRALSIAT